MMQDILFIVPPTVSYKEYITPLYNRKSVYKNEHIYAGLSTNMPLGIISISSYIKKHSTVRTKLVDFNVIINKIDIFTYKNFADLFEDSLMSLEYPPTIIGISVLYSPSYSNLLDLIRICHKIFKDTLIVTGGGLPQNIYKHLFEESPSLHGICYGEGEKPFLGLVLAEDKYGYLEKSTSWITRNKINEVKFEYDFIEDLDEIPFYDYELLDTKDYSLYPGYDGRCGVTMGVTENFSVMTSRGCPHKCNFCASHSVHGRRVRYHSVERMGEDFRKLKEKYRIKTLIFQDDYLMGKEERVHSLIKILKSLGLHVVFQNGLNLYALDWEMLNILKDLGVKQLSLSIESGSQRVLTKIMKKPLTLEIAKKVADDCRKLGIYTVTNILLGSPGETKKDIEDTKTFLKGINANWYGFPAATPLPGSELLDVCIKNNYLTTSFLEADMKLPIIKTDEFTPEYIAEKMYELNLDFNFVNNLDVRLGEYELALIGFENAIVARRDHAFAYYYAAQCYEKLGRYEEEEKANQMAKQFLDIPFWKQWAERFNIYEKEEKAT